MVLLITFVSLNQWSAIPIGNTYVVWALSILTIIYMLRFRKREFDVSNPVDYKFVSWYLLWLAVCIVRGFFVPDNYWEWKQLVAGSIALSLPLLVYPFAYSGVVKSTMQMWLKWAVPAFALFFMWMVDVGGYSFYLGPVFLLICLFPLIPKTWKFLVAILAFVMLIGDFDARSQVIKTMMSVLVGVGCYFHRYIGKRIYRFAHIFCYILPLVLLGLGLTGVFNPFEKMFDDNKGKFVEQKMVEGEMTDVDISADTRTFIYEEVIQSALDHNYVILGRTPARGNDSRAFGAFNAEELKTGKYERYSNELCHLNVFTWTGLIGIVLYSLIYLKASWLAVYRSRNDYIKLLGCFIAFRWAFGWIEDVNRFDIMNIFLWMIIAMGLSAEFRGMTNAEFARYVKSFFKRS